MNFQKIPKFKPYKEIVNGNTEDPIPFITQTIPKMTLLSSVPTPQVFPPSPPPLMPLIPLRSPPPTAVVRIKVDIVGYSDESVTDESDDITDSTDIKDIKPPNVKLLHDSMSSSVNLYMIKDVNIEMKKKVTKGCLS